MSDSTSPQLDLLARHLLRRRDAILANWSARITSEGDLAELALLSRGEFYDHIPNVLNALHGELRQPEGKDEDAAVRQAGTDHGAHRWQQGFDLLQVIRDWGDLHRELLREFDRFSAQSREAANEPMFLARDILAQVIHEGIARSIEEYQRLQRVEAEGRASDIDRVLSPSRSTGGELDAASRRQLSGNLDVIRSAAEALANAHLEPGQMAMLDQIREASGQLEAMLSSLRDLARLEAELEDRAIEPLDAAQLLRELVTFFEESHGLAIEYAGPVSLAARGDRSKIQRIVCSVVLDVLRGQLARKMILRCQANPPRRWSLIVEVLRADPSKGASSDLAEEIEKITYEAQASQAAPPRVERVEATAVAEIETGSTADSQESAAECAEPSGQGPGIALAIVRRLCELLDATLEINARAEYGSTFRVILPREYKE